MSHSVSTYTGINTKGQYVKLIWLLVISVLMLGVSVVWFYKEYNPEWKQYQRAVIKKKIAKEEESYDFW